MPRRARNPRWEGAADPLFDRKPDREIDLHGLTVEQAVARVRSEVTTLARSRSGSVFHIITGKGRGSPGKPVLKPRVLGLIKGELAPLISDWARDHNEAGFLVRLR